MNGLIKFWGIVLFVYGAYMLYSNGLMFNQLAIAVAGFSLAMIDFDRRRSLR